MSDSDKPATPKRTRSRSGSPRARSSPRLAAQADAASSASAAASSSAAVAAPSAACPPARATSTGSSSRTRVAAAAASAESEDDSDWNEGSSAADGEEIDLSDAPAGAAELFSAIIQRLQGRGGGAGEATHVALEEILAGLQQQGLVTQDEEGNIVLMGDDAEEEEEEGEDGEEEGGAVSARARRAAARARRQREQGEDGEDGEDEEEDEDAEDEEEEDAEEYDDDGAEEEEAGGAGANNAGPEVDVIQKDEVALREFLAYAALTPSLYPASVLASQASFARDFRAVAPQAHLLSLGAHFIPSHCTAESHFDGRAFCGKFSSSSSADRGGSKFATATQDGVVHLFETDTWRMYKEIAAADVGWSIVDIDFSGDARFVIYSSWSNAVHLINATGAYELHEALDFQPPPQMHCCMFGIRFSPNESREILAGLNNGIAILYDIERKRKVWSARAHDDDINSVCWLDDSGNLFATGSDDASIRIWDRRLLASPSDSEDELRGAAVPGHSVLRHSRRAVPVGGFLGHQHGLTCVSALPDGNARYMLSNSKDQSMKLWDLRRSNSADAVARCTEQRQSHRRQLDYRMARISRSSMAAAAAATACAGGGGEANVDESDRSVLTFSGHTVAQTLIRCDFSPQHSTGCRYAVSGSSDGRIHVYDTTTGECVKRISGHRSIVRDVAWQDNLIVSSSWDRTVRRHAIAPEKLADNSSAQAESVRNVAQMSRLRRMMGGFDD